MAKKKLTSNRRRNQSVSTKAESGYRGAFMLGEQVAFAGGKKAAKPRTFPPTQQMHRAKPVQPSVAHEKLVRALLDNVPVAEVMVTLREYVTESNRAEQMLEAYALKGELAKPAIERISGPSWSTEEAARAMGKSAETVRNYVRENHLVGYTAPSDRTRLRIPQWQFDVRSVPHAWVPALIRAFGENGWPLIDFITAPRSDQDGKHYLHLLLNGRADEVVAAAMRSNPD